MVWTIAILVVISFLIPFGFPGEMLTNVSGIVPQSEEQKNALVAVFKLDQSILSQFLVYLDNLFSGNWGVSSVTQLNLKNEIAIAFPATIELVCYALLVSSLLGIPIGFLSALQRFKPLNISFVSFSIVGYSFPVFWLALLFISLFCIHLNWLPINGRLNLLYDIPHSSGFMFIDIYKSNIEDKWDATFDAMRHAILPTLSVSIVTTALFIRFSRRSMLDVMKKEYITAARSRGFTKKQIFFKHGVKNALLPILPMFSLQITTLITNVMIIETIFSWPGIGNWLLQAIYKQDYPAIRMGMLIVALFVMALTITLDFITRAFEPNKDVYHRATT